MAAQQPQQQYQSFVQPGMQTVTGQPQYTQILGADGKPISGQTHHSSSSSEKRHSKEFEKSSSEKRNSREIKPASSSGEPTEKTPKDIGIRFQMHEDESGRKEVDAKFHFEGKRDKKPEDEDDKDRKSKDSKESDSGKSDKAEKVGHLVSKVGDKIQEKAAEKQAHKEPQLEIIEPKNASVHPDNGLGTKIVQKIKHKIGETLQETAAEMLVKNPGDQPRDLDASIKHRLEQANRLEREAFVEEQIANDHNLRRAERKEAKKRANEAKYRAKVEVATAEAEKHVLENHTPEHSSQLLPLIKRFASLLPFLVYAIAYVFYLCLLVL